MIAAFIPNPEFARLDGEYWRCVRERNIARQAMRRASAGTEEHEEALSAVRLLDLQISRLDSWLRSLPRVVRPLQTAPADPLPPEAA